jgi:hypothetical protein
MTQLPDESLFGDYGEWPGRDVLDSGGERLGGVREIYLDRETGQPEWVLVDVDGGEARFVPLADAAVESTAIRVAHAATVIRDAPGIGSEPRIDQSEERRLYAHYGLGYSEADSGSGLPTDDPPTMEHQAAPPAAPYDDTNGTTSWSDVAPSDTHDAPPPAEPPSPVEMERPETPEPPAIPLVPTSGAPEPEEEPALTPHAAPPDTSVSPPLDEPQIAVPVTPDVVPTPPEPVAAAPEMPKASWTPPPPQPEPEPSGGALALVKSRPGGIAAGIVVAAVLLFIIRKLR